MTEHKFKYPITRKHKIRNERCSKNLSSLTAHVSSPSVGGQTHANDIAIKHGVGGTGEEGWGRGLGGAKVGKGFVSGMFHLPAAASTIGIRHGHHGNNGFIKEHEMVRGCGGGRRLRKNLHLGPFRWRGCLRSEELLGARGETRGWRGWAGHIIDQMHALDAKGVTPANFEADAFLSRRGCRLTIQHDLNGCVPARCKDNLRTWRWRVVAPEMKQFQFECRNTV